MPRAFVVVKPTGSELVIIIQTLEAFEPLARQSSIFTAIPKYVRQEYIDFKQPNRDNEQTYIQCVPCSYLDVKDIGPLKCVCAGHWIRVAETIKQSLDGLTLTKPLRQLHDLQ